MSVESPAQVEQELYPVWSYAERLEYRNVEYEGLPCASRKKPHHWYAIPLSRDDRLALDTLVQAKSGGGMVELPSDRRIRFSKGADCTPPGWRVTKGVRPLSKEQTELYGRWIADGGWEQSRGELPSRCDRRRKGPELDLHALSAATAGIAVDPPTEHFDLRKSILTCADCFPTPRRCRQHEDLLGGYHEGRILIVSVNPQAPERYDPIYTLLEDSTWERRAVFGDHVLAAFAGKPVNRVFPDEVYAAHPGRAWVQRTAQTLELSPGQFASHFAIVDAFKVVTNDQAGLEALPEHAQVIANCPKWLKAQINILKPRLVILAGGSAVRAASDVLALPNLGGCMRQLHGSVLECIVDGVQTKFLLTFAFSSQTRGRWREHPGTRNAINLVHAVAGCISDKGTTDRQRHGF